MDSKKILRFCLENGLLVDKDVLNLFSESSDIDSVKTLLSKIKNNTNQKIITKHTLDANKEKVNQIFLELPEEKQKKLEKFKIKLGLSIEISKEVTHSKRGLAEKQGQSFSKERTQQTPEERYKNREDKDQKEKNDQEKQDNKTKRPSVEILDMPNIESKKLDVKDFVVYFRNRLKMMRKFIQQHSDMKKLVSINKISGNTQGCSVIGLVSEKRITKNKNILLEVEDLTGSIRVLINKNKPDLYEEAQNITLDSVMGFSGGGNSEILFANKIVFPDLMLPERKRSNKEEIALFIGDLHVGSENFMEENFLKFIDYLNGNVPNTPEVKKIKYILVAGDVIAGAGIYAGQEDDLNIEGVEEQYEKVAELFSKIRKDITIIICPGNHDAMRIMEPQPVLDEKYAGSLYELENVVLVRNPSNVLIGKNNEFSGMNVLFYHGYSFHYYADNIPELLEEKAKNKPDMIMKFLLKNRHLAPSHSSTLYFPLKEDPFLIKEAPDIFLVGHTHKSTVSYYNNIFLVSCSCWESKTSFQEKMGNEPDYCKVPALNLKTRAVKILDFE
ncbi:hypothetical protein GF378_00165 [Candidatus Pacearchaeota archaeon]|nr:hypothetical protein [Candidatus Pacearchaeota archaeon]